MRPEISSLMFGIFVKRKALGEESLSLRMRRPSYKPTVLTIVILGLACSTIHAVEAPADAGAKIVDVAKEFLQFWDATTGKTASERADLFLGTVVKDHPELFTSAVVGRAALVGISDQGAVKAEVGTYLRTVEPYLPQMRVIAASIRNHLATYAQDFKRTFPDYSTTVPMYITISMFNYDGAVRSLEGQTAALFGVDGIARFHGSADNLKILFDHEFFHRYHDQASPELAREGYGTLWVQLWKEGLATYVSQIMNQGTSDGQALLSATLPDEVAPMLSSIASEMLKNLDSQDQKKLAVFFSADKTDKYPARCGYYVGLLVARRLSTDRTLRDLAVLQGVELQEAIKEALKQLAGI